MGVCLENGFNPQQQERVYELQQSFSEERDYFWWKAIFGARSNGKAQEMYRECILREALARLMSNVF